MSTKFRASDFVPAGFIAERIPPLKMRPASYFPEPALLRHVRRADECRDG